MSFRQRVRISERSWSVVIGLSLIGLILIALTVWYFKSPQAFKAPGSQAAILSPSHKPSAQAIASYTVAPTLPKYIAIPTIGITSTRILSLGLLANHQIASPDNLYDTGWYNGSSKPGQTGVMFNYGHIWTQGPGGVFYHLKLLHPGDKILITRGDNRVFTYQVVSMATYPANNIDMQAVLYSDGSQSPELNLMTCAGTLDKSTGEYNQRLVVFSRLVN